MAASGLLRAPGVPGGAAARVECGQHGIHLVEVSWARPGSGFTLLMEVAMLTFAKQAQRLTWLTRPSTQLKTTRAARWRDDFNEFYEQPTRHAAQMNLKRWCNAARRCRLEPIKEFARILEAHWDGIIAWQETHLSNRLPEGTNCLVQAAKRRARGYRSKDKMITVIYLIAGTLPQPEIHTI